jgi:hypothetical protein
MSNKIIEDIKMLLKFYEPIAKNNIQIEKYVQALHNQLNKEILENGETEDDNNR